MDFVRRIFGGGAAPADRTEEILARHLDRDFMIFPMGEGVVTSTAMARLGQRLGVRFPAEYVSHVSGRFPGVLIEAKERVWPRPKELDVGPFWSFLYAVFTFSPLETSEDWMRLDIAARDFQARSGLRAAPILKLVGDADVYCTDERASILRYDHELNSLTPEGIDFWALLEREVSELAERKNQRLAYDGEAT